MIYKLTCLSTALFLLHLSAAAQSFTISSNQRYLLKDGKPFFWLGDTAWELFHRLDREEADYYLQKRASQGFTVIQAVVLAEFDGLNAPNRYGHLPLLDNDPSRPNEAYFEQVDYIIDRAATLGLTIGLLPTWGDKVFKNSWGKGPEVFNVDNARIYGRWIGNRYKSKSNVIWILGGDRNPRAGTPDAAIWRAMAAGVEEGTGGPEKAMITYHPQPNEAGASEWFHDDSWLDFNMFQTGHCRDGGHYEKIQRAYDRQPTKPVIDGEPIYEDHPVCFNVKEYGTSNAYDVRKAAYLHLFAGAFGHTYGCHDVWQMYSIKYESVNGPNVYWPMALDLPGARQMQHVRKLMESRPLLDRVPDQSIIVEKDYFPADRIQATRGRDYAFVYSASGRPFTVNMGKISGTILNAAWYNPRTGEAEKVDAVENKGQHLFTPPRKGYGQDWVLIMDDAAKNYPLPK